MSGVDGTDVAVEYIKNKIKGLVEVENPRKPLLEKEFIYFPRWRRGPGGSETLRLTKCLGKYNFPIAAHKSFVIPAKAGIQWSQICITYIYLYDELVK